MKLPALLTVSALLLSACAPVQQAASNTDALFTFSTVGDSRENPTTQGLSAQNEVWLQTTRAWSRLMVEANDQGVRALFFNGDMIMGYTTDRVTLDRQCACWRGTTTTLTEHGTYVVPLAGNHEVKEKGTDAAGKGLKLARPGNEDAWQAGAARVLRVRRELRFHPDAGRLGPVEPRP